MINNKKGNQRSYPMGTRTPTGRVAFMGKKAAMEMSVGTIVTIVLLMSVLVLGIFLVQKIFGGSSDAIDQINNQVEGQINELFADRDISFVILPSSGKVTVKKGDDPSGAAFSFKNPEKEQKEFIYNIEAIATYDYKDRCGSTMSKELADKYIDLPSGPFLLRGSQQLDTPKKIFFQAPKSAVDCTVPYRITIEDNQGIIYGDDIIRVTFK